MTIPIKYRDYKANGIARDKGHFTRRPNNPTCLYN